MLGLIIKDIRLIKNQGIVSLLLFIGLMGLIMVNTMNAGGFVAYAVVMAVIYALNTISFDNFNNGYAFLFTLPVSPKLYAAEKYVLSLLFSAGACLVSGAVAEIFMNKGADLLVQCVSYAITWVALLWMPIVMLPLQLKFGAEKSRIVTILVFGTCAGLVYLMLRTDGEVVVQVISILKRMEETYGMGGCLALSGLFTAAAYALSMGISMHIMERKEF